MTRVIVSEKSLESTKNRRYHRPGSECPDAPACHIKRYACEWVAVDRDALPERYSACKNCDPELDQVRACPECDSASTRRRHPSRASADRLDDCEYRCEECRTSFDQPVWRQPYHKPSVGTSPLARKLREADPEDLGLSPEGERDETAVDRGEGVRTDGGGECGHVLFSPASAGNRTFHDPDPENPERPACPIEKRNGSEWRRKSRAVVPDDWRRCSFCADDVEFGGPGGDPRAVTNQLDEMAPEDLGLSPTGERPPDVDVIGGRYDDG